MRTIYVASKTKYARMWRELKVKGYPIISTWIDEAGPGESSDLPDLAQRCIDEAKRSTFLLLYCEKGDILKGALVEIGAALAYGVPIRCVGHCESIVSVFSKHPLWSEWSSLDAALHYLD